MSSRALLCVTMVIVAGCARPGGYPAATPAAPPVHAVIETEPVASPADAADDPAIWVHPTDALQSRVIGTDKQRGLQVYDLDGRLRQSLPDGRMNNVDLRDGFRVGDRLMTVVAASNRTDQTIALYWLDPDTGLLTRAGDPVRTGFDDPYGLCLYTDTSGRYFVFVNDSGSGRFRQWRIRAEDDRIVAERVREFAVGSQAEGCVADDATGALYVAEEDRALWRYSADAAGGSRRRLVDRVGGANGLVADIEGVSIWHGADGRGFIVLSNQGANNYAVYRREGDNAFVGIFHVAENAALGIDGTSETDGLAVSSQPLGAQFPDGLLVVQDGRNLPEGANQNFKFISWRDVAHSLGIADEIRPRNQAQ